jgi:hypothetical protein
LVFSWMDNFGATEFHVAVAACVRCRWILRHVHLPTVSNRQP